MAATLRPYEVMIIIDADLEEEAVRSAVDRATQLLQNRGAELGYVDFWGKRRFAYRLKHRWEGNYVLLAFQAEPPVVAELDRVLYLADEVLRHKVIRIPDKVAGRERPTRPAEPVAEAAPATSGAES